MVRIGIIRSMMTLMFWKSGRSTPSATDMSRAAIGFIAACMLTRA